MLDPDEWDLILDDGGQIVDTAGAYGIAQNVANAVRLFTDDAYYFRDRGIPHFTLDLGRKLNKRMICAEYESAAVGVDGVLSANLLDVTLAHGGVAVTGEQLTDRTLTGDLEIVTEDGEVVNVTLSTHCRFGSCIGHPDARLSGHHQGTGGWHPSGLQ